MAKVKRLIELFDFTANHNIHMAAKVDACKTYEEFEQVMTDNGWNITTDLAEFIKANFKELVGQNNKQSDTEE